MDEATRKAVAQVLADTGLTVPQLIAKLDLEPQVRRLVAAGADEKTAQTALLVSYGKAVSTVAVSVHEMFGGLLRTGNPFK